MGNPRLMPEKTISYEAGYKQGIGKFLLMMNVFYKDIFNWTSRKEAGRPPEFVFSTLTNRSWADVRGIELIVRKHFSDYFSLNVNYTYQIVKGSASDPFETGIEGAAQPIYLDWDRRHLFNANLNVGVPSKWGPSVGTLSILGDWDLTILYRYKSGLPYTASSHDPVPRENTERMDPVMQTDLKFSKRFSISQNIRLLFLIEGFNIFNRQNLLFIQDVDYWEETGNPEGRNYRPNVWGPSRHFRLGLGFEF
jgi:outer membrane receptor protein involved in Fe transport